MNTHNQINIFINTSPPRHPPILVCPGAPIKVRPPMMYMGTPRRLFVAEVPRVHYVHHVHHVPYIIKKIE